MGSFYVETCWNFLLHKKFWDRTAAEKVSRRPAAAEQAGFFYVMKVLQVIKMFDCIIKNV